jgi:hypothetical protein
MRKLFVVLLSFALFSASSAQDALSVTNKMITAISLGKSYQYIMKSTERIEGKMYVNKILTKVNENPKKVFIDNIEGENKGVQVLYVKGERDNKVLINKLFGIKLDPFNGLIRKDQHHTVLESGFSLLLNSIKDAKKRATDQGAFDQIFKLVGTVIYDGMACYKLELIDPTFTYVDYTIASGETLYSISMKKNVCEQLIVEKNGFSGFNSGKEGSVIKIPSSYAKKTILYIDKTNYFPIYQEMYDEKGMFEKYEFTSFKLNPTFSAIDFSEDNPAYNF